MGRFISSRANRYTAIAVARETQSTSRSLQHWHTMCRNVLWMMLIIYHKSSRSTCGASREPTR